MTTPGGALARKVLLIEPDGLVRGTVASVCREMQIARVRQTISCSIDGEKVLPTEATTKALMPINKMGRRPKRSDSGPQNIWDTPNASSSAVSVSCACDMAAPKPSVSAGRAGR